MLRDEKHLQKSFVGSGPATHGLSGLPGWSVTRLPIDTVNGLHYCPGREYEVGGHKGRGKWCHNNR